MAKTIEIEDSVTVGSLADKLMIPVTQLIGELMKNGIIATVNEQIDFDTAQIILGELGFNDTSLVRKAVDQVITTPRQKKPQTNATDPNRPPVVAVMGHVDHGKTSLLDAIRGAEIAKHEAGGITQHISAYQVKHNNRLITFLDTPGHEAFAAVRAHGAELTDLVVIVVAADDGVKPQTIEAIRFARQAGARIIVAINKIDKPESDPNRVKQQLAEQNVMVEGWGGDVVAVEVSAKTKVGIETLLDMILLVADVEDLRAPVTAPAEGLVIEAHMERGRGPVAHALVTAGTLHDSDYIIAGASYGKIRSLNSPDGARITSAGPSSPVVISGLRSLPEFADTFTVVSDEKSARSETNAVALSRKTMDSHVGINSGELISMINRSNRVSELPVLLKADVQGSLTSVIDSLKSLDTDEVIVRIVSSGVGSINESDIHLAHTAKAVIYGFNVPAPVNIMRLANRDHVIVNLYDVIYELINDAKGRLSKLLAPEIVEAETGRVIVKGIFKTSKTEVICGGEVTKGKIKAPSLAKIIRAKQEIAEAQISNVKRGPQDTKEVIEGEMCGLNLQTKSRLDLLIGDEIVALTRETVERTL